MKKQKNREQAFYRLMRPDSPWQKSAEQRAGMTIACRDADELPRVSDAGGFREVNGTAVQVMHNGLLVKRSGYQGEWQAEVIQKLRGVHEPQEEKVFFEVLKHIKNATSMIELGSWWSYYSMWYLKDNPNAVAVCCEPDPQNIELGKFNMELNGFKLDRQAKFYQVASGSKDGQKISFKTEAKEDIKASVMTVDAIVKDAKLAMVDILHLDIQGAEIHALHGALGAIKSGKIRFVFVSTHHYAISENPNLHQECVEFLRSHGASIVASHSVLESCSGDGLIVASFDQRDKNFHVAVSHQSTHDSLFRPHEEDVKILWDAYDSMLKEVLFLEKKTAIKEQELAQEKDLNKKLQAEIDEIGHLSDHIKRQMKIKLDKLKGTQ